MDGVRFRYSWYVQTLILLMVMSNIHDCMYIATALAIISMRGVGIIGHRDNSSEGDQQASGDSVIADDSTLSALSSSTREKISQEQDEKFNV
jgi:hypothetical protein